MDTEMATNNEKFVRINNRNININRLTAFDMEVYIEKNHPEDKRNFSEEVFNASPVYNHFRAKQIFLRRYFPEVLKRKEKVENAAVLEFRNWLD